MEQRHYLAPNGRKAVVAEFRGAVPRFPKSNERQSVFAYLRTGRQNSEGFGGGRLIQK